MSSGWTRPAASLTLFVTGAGLGWLACRMLSKRVTSVGESTRTTTASTAAAASPTAASPTPDACPLYQTAPGTVVRLVDTLDALVDATAAALRAVERSCALLARPPLIIGMDTEWSGTDRVAILQLGPFDSSVGVISDGDGDGDGDERPSTSVVLLLRMQRIAADIAARDVADLARFNYPHAAPGQAVAWPRSLTRLLQHPDVVYVGSAIGNDVKLLERQFGLTLPLFVDLQHLARREGSDTPNGPGLAGLAQTVLHCRLSKAREIRCGDWGVAKLNQDQIEYAAKDAVVARDILRQMYATSPTGREGLAGNTVGGAGGGAGRGSSISRAPATAATVATAATSTRPGAVDLAAWIAPYVGVRKLPKPQKTPKPTTSSDVSSDAVSSSVEGGGGGAGGAGGGGGGGGGGGTLNTRRIKSRRSKKKRGGGGGKGADDRDGVLLSESLAHALAVEARFAAARLPYQMASHDECTRALGDSVLLTDASSCEHIQVSASSHTPRLPPSLCLASPGRGGAWVGNVVGDDGGDGARRPVVGVGAGEASRREDSRAMFLAGNDWRAERSGVVIRLDPEMKPVPDAGPGALNEALNAALPEAVPEAVVDVPVPLSVPVPRDVVVWEFKVRDPDVPNVPITKSDRWVAYEAPQQQVLEAAFVAGADQVALTIVSARHGECTMEVDLWRDVKKMKQRNPLTGFCRGIRRRAADTDDFARTSHWLELEFPRRVTPSAFAFRCTGSAACHTNAPACWLLQATNQEKRDPAAAARDRMRGTSSTAPRRGNRMAARAARRAQSQQKWARAQQHQQGAAAAAAIARRQQQNGHANADADAADADAAHDAELPQLCRHFFSEGGVCPYGDRCRYSHYSAENRVDMAALAEGMPAANAAADMEDTDADNPQAAAVAGGAASDESGGSPNNGTDRDRFTKWKAYRRRKGEEEGEEERGMNEENEEDAEDGDGDDGEENGDDGEEDGDEAHAVLVLPEPEEWCTLHTMGLGELSGCAPPLTWTYDTGTFDNNEVPGETRFFDLPAATRPPPAGRTRTGGGTRVVEGRAKVGKGGGGAGFGGSFSTPSGQSRSR